MNSLVIPHGSPGINAFSTASWWAAREPELASAGVVREAGQDATMLTWPEDASVPWEGRVELLLTDVVTGWLRGAGVAEMIATLSGWAEAVVAAGARSGTAALLAIEVGPVESLGQLVTLAGGKRWPPLDPAAQVAAPDPADRRARRLDDALRGSLGDDASPAWPARGWGRRDAVASIERALAVVDGLSAADAARMREATAAALDRIAAAVRIVGPRDALLWPVPVAEEDDLPTDVVVRAAIEVLDATTEHAVRPSEDAPTAENAGRSASARRLLGRLRGSRR